MQWWRPEFELGGNKFGQLVPLLNNEDISLILKRR